VQEIYCHKFLNPNEATDQKKETNEFSNLLNYFLYKNFFA